MVFDFLELPETHTQVGSKAFVLAMMAQKGLPVPAGMVLTALPESPVEWEKIRNWWRAQGDAPLAVRSSAFGEDSEEMSFAGQNQTFLNVHDHPALERAIVACFASVDRETSQSYRQHFIGTAASIPMNVVLQVMIAPRFSGVYFSVNPVRAEDGAVLEYVPGLGEALVSGQVNPHRALKRAPEATGPLAVNILQKVFSLGEAVERALGQKIDMEWAVDAADQVHLLQARPITSQRSETRQKIILHEELARVQREFTADAWWDGQTFAEWTGQPTKLTFEVWQRAFAQNGSFDRALRELGYVGFPPTAAPQASLMHQIFGRAYVDMEKMVPLYFGPIPYRIDPLPKPHLKFEWYKISPEGILRTPTSLWRMLKVGWNMSANRRSWIEQSRKELTDFKHKLQRPSDGKLYATWETSALIDQWQKEIANFSQLSLKWPLVLVVLIEATHQSLRAILKSVTGADKVEEVLRLWMGAGLKTATFEMNRYFLRAQSEPRKREFFFSRFGHRGPGELELSHPRWSELGDAAFGKARAGTAMAHVELDVEQEIRNLKTFKEVILLEEWKFLKELLELREQWKLEILRPYAHIRFLSLELGQRLGVGLEVFHLSLTEIPAGARGEVSLAELKQRIRDRKLEASAFKSVSLPDVLLYSQLAECLVEAPTESLRGLPLSHGLTKGVVRRVEDPSEVDFADWPDNVILVAAATDPGWTGLLTRVRGVVVERGGVLSHCAIVAREMGLPAINLPRATRIFKDGDVIWIDGHHGSVRHATT
ncbi:MAG: PEP/pyruvate-binding domain-containing protein [Bacteriovoracia bacterium]